MSAVEHHTGHEIEEVVVGGISSLDEPSVEWGWHQHSKKVGWIAGGCFAVFLLLMLFGNHIGHVEDIWLVGTAVAMLLGMVYFMRRKKDDTAKKNRVYEVPEGHYSTTHH